MAEPFVIGIAGGTGSGKTTFAHALAQRLGNDCTLIAHDCYYRAQDNKTLEERAKLNYDHPNAYETELLVEHLKELRDGRSVEVPTYDFSHHTRASEVTLVHPSRVIIVEGILILADERLRDLMDLRIYVDVDADVRILRRLQRDVNERGRSIQSVIDQYLATVKPMHNLYVEPSKTFANIVIPGIGSNSMALDLVSQIAGGESHE